MLTPRKRSGLLQDTSHSTSVGHMRSAFGLYTAFWRSPERTKGFVTAGVIGALTFADVYMAVQIASLWKEVIDAITARDLVEMGKESALFLGYSGIMAGIIAGRHLAGQRLHLQWRGWLTEQFNNAWLSKKAFFHINNVPGLIDNPDARIAEDTNKLVGHLIGLSMGVLHATSSIITFTNVMLNMAGTHQAEIMGRMMTVPNTAFWLGFGAAVGCAGIGTWLGHKIGSPLFFLNEQQQRCEADFRASLFNIRSNAPEIASYEGQIVERKKLSESFNEVCQNWLSMMRVQANLMFFTHMYGDTSRLLSIAVGGTAFTLSKNMTTGAIFQFAEVFDRLRGSLSWFVHVFPALFEVGALTKRLASFAEQIEKAQDPATFYDESGTFAKINKTEEERSPVLVDNVHLRHPLDKSILLHVPRLEIAEGDKIVFTGKSGSGKSTLIRAIRGLWKYGEGDIIVQQDRKMMFVPQSPYILDNSTLRENLCYPFLTDEFTDEQLHEVLDKAQLGVFKNHLDDTERGGTSWKNSLSQGEKQRLVFARIFLHRPDTLFLDEATSALDGTLQRQMYRALIRTMPKATIISVAHRAGVAGFHRRHIHIEDGQLHEQARKRPGGPAPA